MTDTVPTPELSSTDRWRALLADRGYKVHSAADVFPMMPLDELETLAKDIRENGLQQGITLYTDRPREEIDGGKPPESYLLDGRNRIAAIELAFAGSEAELTKAIDGALRIGSQDGEARLLCSDQDPVTFVISANAHRRHMTREQKREVIEKLLVENPARSDREIAKSAKASHSTVATIRAEIEGRGQISHVPTRTDSMGRQQPAHKSKSVGKVRPPPSSSEQESLFQLREEVENRAPPQKDLGSIELASTAESGEPTKQDRLPEDEAKQRQEEQHEAADKIARFLVDEIDDPSPLFEWFPVSDAARCEFVELAQIYWGCRPPNYVPPPRLRRGSGKIISFPQCPVDDEELASDSPKDDNQPR